MSDKCPKCGANRTQFEGQTSWDCGSYQSLLGGSHIHRPQFKLMEGECCKTRQALTARESELAEAKQRVAELEAGINEGRLALRSFVDDAAFVKSDSVLVDSVMDVASFLAALLPADRIHNIPGKEDDDGEMH